MSLELVRCSQCNRFHVCTSRCRTRCVCGVCENGLLVAPGVAASPLALFGEHLQPLDGRVSLNPQFSSTRL